MVKLWCEWGVAKERATSRYTSPDLSRYKAAPMAVQIRAKRTPNPCKSAFGVRLVRV